MKQVLKCCAKRATRVNAGAAQMFERYAANGNNDDDDGDTSKRSYRISVICNIAALVLAISGMVYAVFLYCQKVLLHVLLLHVFFIKTTNFDKG